jgi:glycosyltransferase involved in cell wall biosynthesis
METIASGGVEQRRLILAQWFNREKYELKLICTNTFGVIPEELEKLGVEIFSVGSFSHPFHFSKHLAVLKILRDFKPHIIHGATFEGNSLAAIAGKLGKVPVIILEETSDPQNRKKRANMLLKLFVSFSDCIVAISPNVEDYLIRVTNISKSKVKLINNGVNIPKGPDYDQIQKIRVDLGIGENEIVIGFVGRLYDEHKRISDLILAFSLLKMDSVKLMIVGDGKDRDSLKALAMQKGISEKVIMVGYQGDPSVYYQLMTMLCIPSSREGFGLVAAEAMLHHLPVVATNVGGLKNIIIDHETGFLVPPFSPEILADKLGLLINNPKLRQEFGERGFQRAAEHFTSERYCQEVEDLYLGLLKRKGIFS